MDRQGADEGFQRALERGVAMRLVVYVREALEAGIDLDEGTFIMGPELPDISSSAARAALCRGDDAAAAALLHPAVLAWCQRHGPWKRERGSNIE